MLSHQDASYWSYTSPCSSNWGRWILENPLEWEYLLNYFISVLKLTNISYPRTILILRTFVDREIAGYVTFLFAKLTVSSMESPFICGTWIALIQSVLMCLCNGIIWISACINTPSITPAIYSWLLSLFWCIQFPWAAVADKPLFYLHLTPMRTVMMFNSI